MTARDNIGRVKDHAYRILEAGMHESPISRIANGFLMVLIVLNVLVVMLETVEPLALKFAALFEFFLVLSISVFTFEYLLRLWACTEEPFGKYKRPILGRLRYMISPLAIIDLIAILPFYLSMIFPIDLRFIRVFRLLWIIKIMRYLPAMTTLVHVLKRERRTLAAALVLMLVLLFLASSLMYSAEHEIQPQAFASIPHALWWGVATLTTVGYGDVVPQSMMGRMLGVIIMLLGIAMFALPAGILASAFTEEVRRRNFIVTWNMVAQVPFFSRLNAKEIAKIGELLHPRIVMPNEIVFQRDEEAESMYFIVSGEVEVEVLPEPVRLRKGDFFGEMGILFDRTRSVTVMALSYTELLELDAKDFRRAFDSNTKLKQRIIEEAERRMAKTPSIY